MLATLAVGSTLWAAQALILPVLLAMFFALIGNPIIRGLQRLWMPRFVGALLVLALDCSPAGALGNQLIEPAGEWMRQAPREMRELAPKLREMAKPMQEANKAAENIARAAGGEIQQAGAGGPHRGQRSLQGADRDAARCSPRCWRWCC